MSNKEMIIKGKFRYRPTGWKFSNSVRFLLFVALAFFLYTALAGEMLKETYDIRLNSVADRNILAPEQIEDKKATAKAEEEAAQKVQPVYTAVSLPNEQLVDSIFRELEQINADEQVTFEDKVNIYKTVLPRMYDEFFDSWIRSSKSKGLYSEQFYKEMKSKLEEQKYRLQEETFFKLPRLTREELAEMKPVAMGIVERLMTESVVDAQTVRAKVPEMVNTSSLTKKVTRELVQEIARFSVSAGKFADTDATERERAKARENTPTVYISKGDILVAEGETITEDLYQKLADLELLKDRVQYWPQLGLGMLVAVLSLLLYLFVRDSRLPVRTNNAQLIMLMLIVVINVLVLKLVSIGQGFNAPLGLIAPVAMGTILIAILLDDRLAFISSILFAIVSSIMFNQNQVELFNFKYGFIAIAVCIISIFAIQKASQRSSILKAGILISLLACFSQGALLLLEDNYDPHLLLLSLAYAFGGGLLTAVLVIGIMPFFEVTFGILSPLKLVELSNPNHPLLRKLLTETPGSYHHSIMVGNLSEAAAEAIGANGLLCRVGSFYHDIGKTKRPGYFIENQMGGDNPHDHINPELSKSIIIAHARDGVEMLKEYKIPKQICDIAEQHHGTTLLKYFYVKARKLQEERGEEPNIPEETYRYPGPKAQTKEAAIVGIADCVEAAVRSLRSPTIEQIDSTVQKIIKGRLDDGQFNECDLTLKELDVVGKTLKETVLGIFHSRIEYPEDLTAKKPSDNEKGGVSA
ncbi:HD family phosphohydrolase [Paenibacillus turpanensis]|uniref:HD family phosphohydrolase n=1 Tax=Paenibacillus turpanensis TaxID=2689078 RepID=UPI00140B7F9B|nr:HDIG domain-containing metalloprotein [Paenibacillus turpanensis]